MKITFLVARKGDCFDNLDLSALEQLPGDSVRVEDSDEGLGEIIDCCTEQKPVSSVLIAYEPLRFRDDLRLGLMKRLLGTGLNPASIGFVNLNGILLCAENDEQIMERLILTTSLAHERVERGSPLPEVTVKPVKRCLCIGVMPEDVKKNLDDNGIKVITIWNKPGAGEDSEIKLVEFSGLPGEYHLRLARGETEKELICGAIVVQPDGLSEERKTQIALALNIPYQGDEFVIPSNRHVLVHGVWMVDREKSMDNSSWVKEIISLLGSESCSLYLDACTVDMNKCGLCGSCIKTCMFSANSIDIKTRTIHFDQNRCSGCGNCVTACPMLARDLHHYSNDYMFSIPEKLAPFQGKDGIRILALFCEHNGYRAVNRMAETGKQLSPSCYFLPVKCGARVGTEIIPDSFRAGFDGVALLVCARDECTNLVGSLDLERRFNLYRTVMKAKGQESGRMRIISIKAKEMDKVHAVMEQFTEYLLDLRADQAVFSDL